MFKCKYINRSDREATTVCLGCECALPPSQRVNGNMCGLQQHQEQQRMDHHDGLYKFPEE